MAPTKNAWTPIRATVKNTTDGVVILNSSTLGVSGLGGGRRVAPGRRPGANGVHQQARVWAVEAAVGDPETM